MAHEPLSLRLPAEAAVEARKQYQALRCYVFDHVDVLWTGLGFELRIWSNRARRRLIGWRQGWERWRRERELKQPTVEWSEGVATIILYYGTSRSTLLTESLCAAQSSAAT